MNTTTQTQTPIEREFEARASCASDINEHMPLLSHLASQCRHVTEFGVRSGNSTVALLHGLDAGGGGELVSYDINTAGLATPDCKSTWTFNQADTSRLSPIAPTDMLFIDTLHDCAQVVEELKHADRVRKYIAFHDTVLFGCREESSNGAPGINHAIWLFLASDEGQKWRVRSHDWNNCGMLVLRRA